jgi:hypothetical protein
MAQGQDNGSDHHVVFADGPAEAAEFGGESPLLECGQTWPGSLQAYFPSPSMTAWQPTDHFVPAVTAGNTAS